MPQTYRPPTSMEIAVVEANQHELTVVTRNVADFAHFSINVLNPFEFR